MGTLKKFLALLGFGRTDSGRTTEALLKHDAARSVGEAQPGRFPGRHVPPGDALQRRTLDVWDYLENHLLTPEAELSSKGTVADSSTEHAEQPSSNTANDERAPAQQQPVPEHTQAARPAAQTSTPHVASEPAAGALVKPTKKGSRPPSSKKSKKETAKRSGKPAPVTDQQDDQLEHGLRELEKVLAAEMHRLNSALSLREEQTQDSSKAEARSDSEQAPKQQKPAAQAGHTKDAKESPASSADEQQGNDETSLAFDIAEPAVLQHTDTQELEAVLHYRSQPEPTPDSESEIEASPASQAQTSADSTAAATEQEDEASHLEVVTTGEDQAAEAELIRIELHATEPADTPPEVADQTAATVPESETIATESAEPVSLDAHVADVSISTRHDAGDDADAPAPEALLPEDSAIAHDYKLWLADFLEIHGGIEGAAVMSSHGRIMAQQFRLHDGLAEGLEQITSLHKLAAMCNDALELGGVSTIQLHGDARIIFVYEQESGPLLVAWLAPEVPIGMVMLEARKVAKQMAAALQEPLSSAL